MFVLLLQMILFSVIRTEGAKSMQRMPMLGVPYSSWMNSDPGYTTFMTNLSSPWTGYIKNEQQVNIIHYDVYIVQ